MDEDQDHPTLAGPTPISRRNPPRAGERRSMVRRTASVGRRWARDTFSREQLVSNLKSIAWVIPLTILIWVYAERAQQDDGEATVTIEVKSADPTWVARLASSRSITTSFKGPKARVDQAAKQFDPRSGSVQVFVEGDRPPGVYEIDVRQQIQKDPRFYDNGITVTACEPPVVTVEVDLLVEEDLEVRPHPELAQRLNRFSFEPKKVKVSAPAKLLAQAKAKGPLFARVDLSGYPEVNTPGTHGPLRAPVNVPFLPDVRVWPENVNATLDVKPADAQFRIDSLPVNKVVVGDVEETHRIVYQTKFIPNVVVYGPADKIKQLEAGTVTPKPEARFRVTPLDAGAGKINRELEYVLPEGIRLKEDGTTLKTIEIEVVKKDGV